MISILEFIDSQVCYEPELNKYSVNGENISAQRPGRELRG